MLPEGADPFVWLFSESAGRAVVAVPRSEELRFTEIIHAADERIPVDALEFGTGAIGAVLERYGR